MPRATPTFFAALVGLPLTGAAAWLAVRADQTHSWMPAAGIGLGIAGVVLLRRALWHDPLRGRPRCPKCLYPFAPLQPESPTGASEIPICPECGARASSVSRLTGPRRRWWLAALAALFIGSLPASFWAQRATNNGFWNPWPNGALFLVLPYAGEEAWREAEARATALWARPPLSPSHSRLLARQCANTLRTDRDPSVRLVALDLLLFLEPESDEAVRGFRDAVASGEPVLVEWAVTHATGSWRARELSRMIGDPAISEWDRAAAVWQIREDERETPEVLRVLNEAADSGPLLVREAASQRLGRSSQDQTLGPPPTAPASDESSH